jgi:predicted acetyltransferase
VADVAVQPTHRRRGILTGLMRRQLEDIHERGEPLAALWASESVIYGRFGYGPAIECEHGTINRDRSAYATPLESEGRVAFVERERIREMAPQVWERVRPERPGMMSRSDARWDSWLRDPDHGWPLERIELVHRMVLPSGETIWGRSGRISPCGG